MALVGDDARGVTVLTYHGMAHSIKLLVLDGFGIWSAARCLNSGHFVWPRQAPPEGGPMTLTHARFDALVLGLPRQRLEQMRVITRT